MKESLAFNRLHSGSKKANLPRRTLLQNRPLIIFILVFLSIFLGFASGLSGYAAIMFAVIPILVLFVYNPLYAFYLFIATLPLYVIPLQGVEGVNASIPRLAGILLFILWAPYVFFTRKFRLIKWDHFLVAVVIFFTWMFISAAWTQLPPKGWIILRAVSQLILAVFIALTMVDTKSKLSNMVAIVIITCSIAGFRSFFLSLSAEVRAVGIAGFDQNEFASMLLIPMMIAISLFDYQFVRSKIRAYMHLIVAFGCFLGALATVSRGFVLSVLAACIALVAIYPDRRRIAILLIIAFLITSPYYLKKYSDRLGNEQFEISSTTEVPRGRVGIWKIGIEVFKQYPIAGVGVGGFPKAFNEELAKDPSRIHFWEYGRVAHNDYLQLMVELGIIGIALWFFLLVQVFKKGFRSLVILDRMEEKYLSAIMRGVIASMVGLLVASFFLGLYHTKFMWLELMFFAVIGSVARLMKEKSPDSEIRKLPDP